ncbi:nucleotide exchange factor GrpE [Pseudonocardia sp. C8]|uniref:nucleotide exchange factor GrpE n=1 Tax=Pseudonocardia sp. C8 TaxID=2762759 RepID=UPI0016433087|nr:nucleotide exchange factor GrpE [Pseudonocardia sp. C8]MBC3192219.1 nucleotide exchange factor GrpE [Pseudonocardia sp. C8]
MTEQSTDGTAAGPDPGTGAADGQEAGELRARIAELEDRWRTAAADLENFRKRTARDAERSRELERARVAREWLPVLDNLDIALQHAESDPGAIVEGLRAVREQAAAVLARLGFPQREDEPGTAFDPARHEAVSTVPAGEFAPGTIVQTVRTGFGDGDHQLRPPGVVVAAPEPS